jgi:hypothetical protein
VAQVAVCSQINTKHINTVWAERTVVEKIKKERDGMKNE